jgi:lipopolysaccharide transport system ATP-binding protein
MSDIAISARALSKRFARSTERRSSLKERVVRGGSPPSKEFWALRDVTFDVERGKTFGIVGHNGSGKSTALKVLTGVYRPTSGEVDVRGRTSALLELGAGFHPELTGRENVVLNGSILGLSRSQIDSAMAEIIDFSGIEAFIDSPVKHYSSGMTLRLGFAIAVKLDPEILIVDEVIAVGDEQFQRRCMDYLHSLRQDGCTIMIVSHALSQIESLCDDAVWLDHGQVRALGDARSTVLAYLEEVNRAEIRDRAGSSLVSGGAHATGSGEIRVLDLEFCDAQGQPVDVAMAGEPITVRFHYRAGKNIERAVFGFLFYTDTGVQLAGRNSFGEIATSVPEGEGVVEFTVPSLPLLAGHYLVTSMVSDGSHIYDSRERDFELAVRSTILNAAGFARIDGSWSITTT